MIQSRHPKLTIYAVTACIGLIGLYILQKAFISSTYTSRFAAPHYPITAGSIWSNDSCGSIDGVQTEILGHTPGFIVLENVWFNDKTFYTYHPKKAIPLKPDQLGSHPIRLIHSSKPPPHPSTCFHGPTIWINENGQKGWHGLYRYFHFAAENLLAGFASLSMARVNEIPERVIIPWERDWDDQWHLNLMTVDSIWGRRRDAVLGVDEFASLSVKGNGWMFFEKIVVLDRTAAHRHNPSTELWGKMSFPIFTSSPPVGFFDKARNAMMRYHQITPVETGIPMVVYIERRHTGRGLRGDDHRDLDNLMYRLQAQGRVDYWHLVLEDFTPREQIEIISQADILIGVHGNGLTHQIWMSTQSIVIELFPPESFLADYATVSQALGQGYYAIQKDHVLYRHEWEAEPGQRNPGKMYDGTEVEVDMSFFGQLMDDILAMGPHRQVMTEDHEK